MALLTVARYQTITGDTTPSGSTISARIEDAVGLLEDELDRPLESDERTEQLWPTRDGRLWPKATPITAVDDDSYQIDGYALESAGPFQAIPNAFTGLDAITVTYTGGFVERSANPTAANRLPACIERDLAFAVYRLLHPAPAATLIPAGATAATLGDASLSWGSGGAGGTNPASTRGWWSPDTLAYRYKRVGGDPL